MRLGWDYYVRLDANGCSVSPTVIGRMVDVTADPERVKVRADGRNFGDHAMVWARGTTVTDPAHVETAARLRKQFQHPRVTAVGDDLTRDLADYDRACGLSANRDYRRSGFVGARNPCAVVWAILTFGDQLSALYGFVQGSFRVRYSSSWCAGRRSCRRWSRSTLHERDQPCVRAIPERASCWYCSLR